MARQLDHENAFLLFDATEVINIAHAQELRVAAAKLIVRDYGVLRDHDHTRMYLKRAIDLLASRAATPAVAAVASPGGAAFAAYLK